MFTGPRRKIADAISDIWEDEHSDSEIDEGKVSARCGLSLAAMGAEFEGCYRLSPQAFQLKVNALIEERKTSELMRLVAKEGILRQKTGSWDPNAQARIREILCELDELEKPITSSFTPLSVISPKIIEWMWWARIALGMLTLVVGDPGLGKSFFATWLASRFSIGGNFPDNNVPAISGGTIYLSAEDSPAYAIRPRADANGADTSRIHILNASSLDILVDLKQIKKKVDEDTNIRLLIIDPLSSFLGEGIDYCSDTSVRSTLIPLSRFLEEKNLACVGVMHPNKKTDLAAIYRIGGSIAFAGVARSVLAVTPHPEDETKRLLRSVKMNYARRPAALVFSLHDDLSVSFEDTLVHVDQNESLSQPASQNGADNSFALEWLQERLSNGGAEYKTIRTEAAASGISERTLFNCRKKLGIPKHASGFGKSKAAYWELPHD